MIDNGTAEEIRERHDTLRITQVVYVYTNGKVYSIDIKGASLGSANKAPTTISFYDYLKLFNADSHVWQYWTNISAALEKKGAKSYFAMTFAQGELVDGETLPKIVAETKILYEAFLAQENYQQKTSHVDNSDDIGDDNARQENIPSLDEIPVINLDAEDEIVAEEIPF